MKLCLATLLELAAIAGPIACLSVMPIEAARWVIAFALVVALSVALVRSAGEVKRSARRDWLRTLGVRDDEGGTP